MMNRPKEEEQLTMVVKNLYILIIYLLNIFQILRP